VTGADAHCFDLVREHDRNRFLASLFAPDQHRPHLLALYAFNIEVTRIREAVSDPQIGLIRQQWWRDTIEGLDGGEDSGHPVAATLGRAIAMAQLPKQALVDLVTAHEIDLYADRMANITELEAYLGLTSSILFQLSALILDRSKAAQVSDLSGLGGVAYGFSQILMDPVRRDRFIPPGMDLPSAIAHARKRLTEARELHAGLPHSILPAFLPVSLTELYLRRIEREPEAPRNPSQFRRQLSLWWHARRETI
jgi:phytoene synthase